MVGGLAVNKVLRTRRRAGTGGFSLIELQIAMVAAAILIIGAYISVVGGTVTVTGRCERGSKLTINGQEVVPEPNGRFTVDLPVPAGQEQFTVQAVAVDRKGYTTTVERHLGHVRVAGLSE